MGFTGILLFIVVLISVFFLFWIVKAVRARNWNRFLLLASAFITLIWLIYFGLLWFIASM